MRLPIALGHGDTTDEDARLVAAAQHRQTEFAALYDKYFLRVYRYVARRVGTQQDAEDVAAQVFIEALDGLSEYKHRNSFAAWLFTIARNKIADHYRRRKAEVPLDSTGEPELESSSPLPEHLVIRNERLRFLASALRKLSVDKQEVLTLRFFAELKYSEIAHVVGKSEAAVKMMVYRALDDLRDRLLAGEEERDAPER
ncbi:MAG: sigma-70 family RNA polymerase sigma factor [Chloroflexi bacterium]|nr:sigma-70 family RNA polymerase sigma factor [Chloroflexota bacterium]